MRVPLGSGGPGLNKLTRGTKPPEPGRVCTSIEHGSSRALTDGREVIEEAALVKASAMVTLKTAVKRGRTNLVTLIEQYPAKPRTITLSARSTLLLRPCPAW